MEESLGTSPPLELRRTMNAQRVAVPHSLQSPQDRATGKSTRQNCKNICTKSISSFSISICICQIAVIPHPHYPDVGARFYDASRSAIPTATEPPPAHRNALSATPPINYGAPGELPAHLLPKAINEQRERDQREKERKSSIPGLYWLQI